MYLTHSGIKPEVHRQSILTIENCDQFDQYYSSLLADLASTFQQSLQRSETQDSSL